jgi:heme A synthase
VPETVFGLPTHAIVVHATVVLLPLAALVVLLHAVWPAARRRLGIVTPLLAGAALVLVPMSTDSGESLERAVGRTALVERHAELADGMLPWAIGLFVVAVGLWLLDRRRARPSNAEPRWLPIVASVLAVVAVLGTVQQIVRVGHAGAEATWSGVESSSSGSDDHDD